MTTTLYSWRCPRVQADFRQVFKRIRRPAASDKSGNPTQVMNEHRKWVNPPEKITARIQIRKTTIAVRNPPVSMMESGGKQQGEYIIHDVEM